MASVKASSTVKLSVTLVLTEEEAIALNEMTKYGIKAFLEGYYKYLGKHYMQPHEKGMRSLFKTIDAELPSHICRINEARKIFDMPEAVDPPRPRKRLIDGKWHWIRRKLSSVNTWSRITFSTTVSRFSARTFVPTQSPSETASRR